jgi:hypothetical protein
MPAPIERTGTRAHFLLCWRAAVDALGEKGLLGFAHSLRSGRKRRDFSACTVGMRL